MSTPGGSMSKHSVRVQQTSADARLNAAFEEADQGGDGSSDADAAGAGHCGGGGRTRSFDYSKSGRPSLDNTNNNGGSSSTADAPQAITAYLQRMQRGGLTQGFGCLLAVVGFRIVALSENAAEMLGMAVGLSTDLRMLFTPITACDLEAAAREHDLGEVNPVVVQAASPAAGGAGGRRFYAVLHRMEEDVIAPPGGTGSAGAGLLLDLEPVEAEPVKPLAGSPAMGGVGGGSKWKQQQGAAGGGGTSTTGGTSSLSVTDSVAAKAIARMEALPGGDLTALCQTVVEEVRRVTGYDRVMAYKFHQDEHGEVVAEAKRDDMEPYLGLHYPATDIPQASRFMFMRTVVRMIGNSAAPAVRVVQAKDLKQPLSLAASNLRAPHGCHMQYLRNMGVAASLTCAVIIDDYDDDGEGVGCGTGAVRKLWGLVCCHHNTPRTVPFPLRAAMERFMAAFGAQVNVELDLAAQRRESHILATQAMLCDMLRRIRGAPIGIVSRSPSIMDLVKCDGAALLYGGRLWPLGTTPSEEQVRELAQWILDGGPHGHGGDPQQQQQVEQQQVERHAQQVPVEEEEERTTFFFTDSLAEAGFLGAGALGDAVCGCAAARITPNSDYLFWFREHTAKEVKWGGAEHNPLDADDETRMSPRSSFKAFLEVVKRRSLPWEEVEVDAVRSLQLILREELEKFCAAAIAAGASETASDTSGAVVAAGVKKMSLVDGGDGDDEGSGSNRTRQRHSSAAGRGGTTTTTTTGVDGGDGDDEGSGSNRTRQRHSSAAGGGGTTTTTTGVGWDKFRLPASLAAEWMEAIRGDSSGQAGGTPMPPPAGAPFNWDSLACFQQTSFVVVDATKADLPIIFASSGFFALTGYTAREVLGGNCRFLQGPDTRPEDVAGIRAALAPGGARTYCGRLLNYRKDGSRFWNLLTIAPIKDEATGAVVKMVGVQMEVSKYTEGARANSLRPNGLPQSLIKYDVRHQDKVSALVADLVAALSRPSASTATTTTASSRLVGGEAVAGLGGGDPAVAGDGKAAAADKTMVMRYSLTGQTIEPLSPARAAAEIKATGRRAFSTSDVPPHQQLQQQQQRRRHRSTTFLSLLGISKDNKDTWSPGTAEEEFPEPEVIMVDDDPDAAGGGADGSDHPNANGGGGSHYSYWDDVDRARRGMDLATTLERIGQSFVITDPRLPDNPIIFASDQFLELTEYSREEVLGRNCRFLQGPDTAAAAIDAIRDAVKARRDVTVQLLNYTRRGRPFWNLFHLQAMRDDRGELQYYIGVQQETVAPTTAAAASPNAAAAVSEALHAQQQQPKKSLEAFGGGSEMNGGNRQQAAHRQRQHRQQQQQRAHGHAADDGDDDGGAAGGGTTPTNTKEVVRATAADVEVAARELPDANLTPDHLWVRHSKVVTPRPHARINSPAWYAIRRVQRRLRRGERLGLKHFRPIKPLGSGDTGSVHLVELRGTGQTYAMKAMDKAMMLQRNKVHRARAERDILAMMDHPFLPTLYASFQTKTHVCLITDFCPNADLFLLLDRQPGKLIPEDAAAFYAAEVVVALEYLHCMGVIYRDLKPENVLLQRTGHILLTDFDLSFLTSCRPQLLQPNKDSKSGVGRKRKRRRVAQQQGQPQHARGGRHQQHQPVFCAEPRVSSNSFVGTEEYIAPEIISGEPHSAAVDWWALGILLYEMLYGRTPFRGRNRQATFVNVLSKELTFPTSVPVSLPGRQLIGALLHRDPARRLGALRGAADIKRHPFFRNINWPLIRWRKPPPLHHLVPPAGASQDDSDSEADQPLLGAGAAPVFQSTPVFGGDVF